VTNNPRGLADRMSRSQEADEAFLWQTFRLPLADARLKAREILDQFPTGGYMTTLQHWRQLPDGQIEFTVCRLRTAD
jgi:hypothetical protein